MPRSLFAGLILVGNLIASAHSQTPGPVSVETIKLDLIDPARYQVPIVLEASRRADVVAMTDGVVKAITTQVGANVREGQELAKMDQTDAYADLAITQADLKQVQAEQKLAGPEYEPVFEAKIAAAQAKVQKAQFAVDRCVLRSPFSGRVLAIPATPGQFLLKGQPVAEVADVANLRVFTVIDRPSGGAAGAISLIGKSTKLIGEDGPIEGKIEAILPLADMFVSLRELHASLSCAWVTIANADGLLEPGTRVGSPVLPDAPLALIPTAAIKTDDPRNPKGTIAPIVQVLRNEYVVDVPVRVLGKAGPGRVQVCGPFRPADGLIVFSKVPLVAGTLVRFAGTANTGTLEARPPDPNARGTPAAVTAPVGNAGSRIAPIGAPGSAAPAAKTKTKTAAPAKADAAPGIVPF